MRPSELRAEFQERGCVGPLPLLAPEECAPLLARLRRRSERAPLDWHKGAAATSRDWFALATDDRLRALVTALLGRDVLLWGASLVLRRPGEVHPWHTDAETSAPCAEALSIWIALDGAGADSSLRVIPHSHRFGAPLQQIAHEHGRARAALADSDVAAWARARDPRAGIETLVCREGELAIFDGRLWHGSVNASGDRTRQAALLQFASPRTPIRIPNPARFEWPLELYEAPRPPCILVNGDDEGGANRIVPGPAASTGTLAELSAGIFPLRLPLARDRAAGWKPHPLLRGATAGLASFGCHVTVLEPGAEPHPPHAHAEEELFLVLEGEPTLVTQDGSRRVARGSLAHYAAGFRHTIRNDGREPAVYLVLKWRTSTHESDERASASVVPLAPRDAARRAHAPGFETRTVLEATTGFLRRLHAHVTTLAPGAGYAPHADAHDVCVVVLEGEIETLGARAGPHDVVFCAAGVPHGIRNAGARPAEYLVLELHGRGRASTAPIRAHGARPDRGARARVRRWLRALAPGAPAGG